MAIFCCEGVHLQGLNKSLIKKNCFRFYYACKAAFLRSRRATRLRMVLAPVGERVPLQ